MPSCAVSRSSLRVAAGIRAIHVALMNPVTAKNAETEILGVGVIGGRSRFGNDLVLSGSVEGEAPVLANEPIGIFRSWVHTDGQ